MATFLKEVSPDSNSLEGLMLKVKLQYFGHLMRRADSLEKTLMLGRLKAGGEGADRGWDGWMASPTQWTWVWVNSGSWWWTGRPGVLRFMGLQRVGHDWTTELNWYIHTFHFRILNLEKMSILYSDLKTYSHSSCHWAAVQEERNNKQRSCCCCC